MLQFQLRVKFQIIFERGRTKYLLLWPQNIHLPSMGPIDVEGN